MPTTTETVDALGRTPLSAGMKALIAAEFAAIPAGKRGAVIFVGTEDGAQAHFAARIDGRWKVAGGLGWRVSEKRPSGHVSVELCW